ITSLDGLVEASQLSRVLGGVGNEIQLMLAKIFWEEYGGGKLSHKHSSYFINMLKELNMETVPEAYFDVVPWEVLANINHSFLLSEKKKNYLRYVGGLLYIEVSAPSAFLNYQKAGERIGLTEAATGYWSTHIKEDIRHGEWMLNKVAVPLANKYPDQAWQVILGYDQQKFISTRAVKSIVDSIRKIDH
ncbi:MAG: iron-containing redox enzyme family protein, partial [Nitrospina sp.]|nr:iron-containing redox enzyme family protein [Nitrospina sp.]